MAVATRRLGWPRLERLIKFGLVGVLGLGLNIVVQAALTERLGLGYVIAAVLATQVSSTANFLLAETWVFTPEHRDGWGMRYLAFLGMNNAALVLRVPIMWVLTSVFGVHYSISNLVSLIVLVLLRFGLADTLIWRTPATSEDETEVMDPDLALAMAASGTVATPVAHLHVPDLQIRPPDDGPLDERPQDPEPEPLDEPVEVAADPWARPFPGQRLLLVLVVAAGTVLRTWQLTAVGFNSDEAVYAGQAASIAGDAGLSPFFPVFRAHPLLFQGVLSLAYQSGTSELTGRLVAAGFGVGTIVAAYAAAKVLYGPRTALLAALVVSLMPYQVIVNRQVLLDGPTTFFATVTLYLLARFAVTQRSGWLVAAAAGAGVTVLTKETYVVLVAAIFAFLALSPTIRVRVRDIVLSVAVFVLVLVPFPLTIVLAGKRETGNSYLSWQLFRRPNHPADFYATTLPWYLGPLVLAGVVVALVACIRRRSWSWREWLLVCWFGVPALFFQLWPVKGFHYLLAASVPLAILGASGLAIVLRWLMAATTAPWRALGITAAVLGVAALAVSLAVPAWTNTQGDRGGSALAGAGGVPGGREMGRWIKDNAPVGAEVMTVGPSMANLVQFYGQRRAWGLSVSPNPLNRNPSYEALRNPDLALRSSEVQYVVWDAYSAGRSSYFSDRLSAYVERYHGNPVFTFGPSDRPTIVVYEVHP